MDISLAREMIKGMIKEGKLVPSELTAKLILKAISKSSNNKFLIDGFPRNDENREVWDRVVRTYSSLHLVSHS
jgi:UMP-CMP kinase